MLYGTSYTVSVIQFTNSLPLVGNIQSAIPSFHNLCHSTFQLPSNVLCFVIVWVNVIWTQWTCRNLFNNSRVVNGRRHRQCHSCFENRNKNIFPDMLLSLINLQRAVIFVYNAMQNQSYFTLYFTPCHFKTNQLLNIYARNTVRMLRQRW